MACWSAENATEAYLRAVKMGKTAKEPDVAEFISALAAGNSAQLMVIACANVADSTTLALVAAAHQTGGQVICILPGVNELQLSRKALGDDARHVKFITGNSRTLIINDYKEADCVVIDCNLENSEGILEAACMAGRNAIVLGFNAFYMGSWRCNRRLSAHLLPIGEGVIVTRAAANEKKRGNYAFAGKNGRWVVKVDKWTGEEHVFRVRYSRGKPIEA